MKKVYLIIIISILFILCLSICEARLGEGENFRSGNIGENSSSGSNDDFPLLFIFHALSFIFRNNPVLGVIVLTFIIFVLLSKIKVSASSHSQKTVKDQILTAAIKQKETDKIIAFNKIKDKDKEFSEEKFLSNKEKIFLHLQYCWSKQQIEKMRPFISSSVYTKFATQLLEQKEKGIRNDLENIRIIKSEIAAAYSDKFFDKIDIKFVAEASDYKTDIKTGKITSGSKTPSTFTEYWSFYRKVGVQSNNLQNLGTGNCPSCGAAIKINQQMKCEFCSSIINSGEYDWVLGEITQDAAFKTAENQNIPGLNIAVLIDNNFCPQIIEDYASAVFFKELYSRRINKVTPLLRYINPDFLQKLQDRWLTYEGRLIYENAAIGSSELQLVKKENDLLFAYVRILFSGIRVAINDNNEKIYFDTLENSPDSVVFILTKKINSPKNFSAGLSSMNCPNCGGPESSSDSPKCDYCGAILNDGSNYWLLSDIITPMEFLSIAQSAKPIRDSDKKDGKYDDIKDLINLLGVQSLMAGLIYIAASDGAIDATEKDFIVDWGKKLNIPEDKIEKWILSSQSMQKAPKIQVPSDPKEAALWARALIRIALINGEIENKERFALRQFCGRLNIQVADLDRLIENEINSI